MNEKEFDRLLKQDINREKLNTEIAAPVGIVLGVVLVIWPLLACFHAGGLGTAVGVVLLIAYVLPVYISKAQTFTRDHGLVFLSECIGFAGTAIGCFGLFVLSPVGMASPILLGQLYADQGRWSLADKFSKLVKMSEKVAPFVPSSVKMSTSAIVMKTAFHSGRYDEAVKLARQLAKEANDLYESEDSEQNRETLIVVQSVVAGYLKILGYNEEAAPLWARVKSLDDFGTGGRNNSLAYVYDILAFAADYVGDWQSCLIYSDRALERSSAARLSSKVLAGETAAARAQALLALRRFDEAEAEAKKSYNAWRTFLFETAFQLSPVYYVMGCVELERGNYETASGHLFKAISIRHFRNGKNHPELSKMLKAYAQCLRKLARDNEAVQVENELNSLPTTGYAITISSPASIETKVSTNDTSAAAPGAAEQAIIDSIDLKKLLDSPRHRDNISKGFLRLALIGMGMITGYLIAGGGKVSSGFAVIGTIVLALFLGQLVLAAMKFGRIRALKARAGNFVKQHVVMRFFKDGKFMPSFSGIVERGQPPLTPATTIYFSLPAGSLPVAFTEKPIDTAVFIDPVTNKPMLALAQGDLFLVSGGALAQAMPFIRPVVIAMLVCGLFMAGILAGLLTGGTSMTKTVPDGKTAQEYWHMGMSYKDMGWTEQSRDALNRAIKLGAGTNTAVKAKRYLETKLPRYPATEDAVEMNIEAYNLSAFTPDQAERKWKECIAKYPKFEWAYSNLGSQYVEQGRYKEGEELLNKALEINPSYLNAWIHLARLKRQQKDFEGAKECLDKAAALDPDDATAKLLKILPE